MPDLWIPDVSEYQSVDFDVFFGPIIVRAHNSNRADNHWPQHAVGASKQPWWAAYQYLTATADPAQAARAFLATLGDHRPNCTILDLEAGDGDQSARQHVWLDVMANDPARDWTYSGDYFTRAHGITVDWVAAYQSREPTTAHQLWQATNAHDFPGIGTCDGSIFHGTVNDLIALTSQGDDMPLDINDPLVVRIIGAAENAASIASEVRNSLNDPNNGVLRRLNDLAAQSSPDKLAAAIAAKLPADATIDKAVLTQAVKDALKQGTG